jgi:hypothetical protein
MRPESRTPAGIASKVPAGGSSTSTNVHAKLLRQKLREFKVLGVSSNTALMSGGGNHLEALS